MCVYEKTTGGIFLKERNIIGQKFGRLTVVSFHHANGYAKYYLCQCDCGKTKIIYKGSIMSGRTYSCGCFRDERIRETVRLPENFARLHRILDGMKLRCYNPHSNRFHRYGGRGIKICDEWLNDPDSFCKWALSNGYQKGLTIDRIDNNKDYSPDNCQWIPLKEQMSNQSTNVFVEYNGERHTISQWAEKLGIERTTLHNRLKYYGWSVEKALTTPVRPY